MDTDEPRFVQTAQPKEDQEQKRLEGDAEGGIINSWTKLSRSELSPEADKLLLWLVRYPVERNHPRPTTDTIPLWKSGDAMTVMLDEKIPSVMQKLVVEGFTAAPVLDAQQRYCGMVDLLDITLWCLQSFGAWKEEERGGASSSSATSMSDAIKNIAALKEAQQSPDRLAAFVQLDRFRNAPVQDVIRSLPHNFQRDAHPIPVYKGFSLFTVVELFARHGLHRVPVVDRDNKILGIVTQSMVISLLDQNLHRMENIKNMPVSSIVPGLQREIITVNENQTAIEAFYLMVHNNVTGLAVVDESGVLVDTISVRDLRGMGPTAEHFERLWLSVKEFKAKCRQLFSQQTPSAPIHVFQDDTFESVVRKCDDGNIHRIFVCSKANGVDKPVPTHVIAQRDILRFLLFQCGLVPDTIEAEGE